MILSLERLSSSLGTTILLLLHAVPTWNQHQPPLGPLGPFFFLCNYHGPAQNYGLDTGQVVVSVGIDGNPRGYTPGQFYNISVSSSETFDSLLMTGLYTTQASPSEPRSRGVTQGSRDVMCSIIHSQVSPQPMRTLSFTWMAPPTGTGCVNFLATATHGQQLLFKDTSIAQLCELGALSEMSARPELAEVNGDSFLIRDAFESGTDFNPLIWSEADGVEPTDECGPVVSGQAATFCANEGPRRLETVPLNLTSAHVLQFFLGGGGCRPLEGHDQEIVIAYGSNGCTDWNPIQRIKAPTSSQPEMHLLTLPPKARRAGTCIQFSQASNTQGTNIPVGQQTSAPSSKPSAKVSSTSEATSAQEEAAASTASTPLGNEEASEAASTQAVLITEADITFTSAMISDATMAPTPAATEASQAPTEDVTVLPMAAISSPGPTELAPTPPTAPTENQPSSPIIPTESPPFSPSVPNESPLSPPTLATTPDSFLSSANPSPSAAPASSSLPPTSPVLGPTSPTLIASIEGSPDSDAATDSSPTPDSDERNIQFIPNDQPAASSEIPYYGCWAIDNLVIVNIADPPEQLEENFDPIDPSDWIFFPGAHVDHQCQSHGNAFVFTNRNQTMTYAATRDLDLDAENFQADAFLYEDFESGDASRLTFENGRIEEPCGLVGQGTALVFDGPNKRQLCTDPFDAMDVDSVRFHLKFGGSSPGCRADKDSPPVIMFVEDEENNSFVLDSLVAQKFLARPDPVTHSLRNVTARHKVHGQVKFCLLQKRHGGSGSDVWAVDNLALLPLLPKNSKPDADKLMQVLLNMNCGNNNGDIDKSPEVSIEYSTDHGGQWHPLHSPCLPGTCPHREYSALSSFISGKSFYGWERVSLPLPYHAQSPHTRFRVVQYSPDPGQWALDDVFIGSCDDWCSGHGMCKASGCSCDFGFEGDRCDRPTTPAPSTLQETFEDPLLISASGTLDVTGGSVGYQCSVVASGKAMVFNHAGKRSMTTADLNTEKASHVQFTMRVGSQSVKSSCPPPDNPWERVLLEASCNGGTTWTLLAQFATEQYKTPMSVSTPLPSTSRGPACRLRWRQPQHSGVGKDVWAIDDVSLVSLTDGAGSNPSLNRSSVGGDGSFTVLAVEMMDSPQLDGRLSSNLGEMADSFCGRMRSLKFSSAEENGEPRALKTKAMKVGPGYIAQYDLVMGCGVPYTEKLDNQIYFLYSVDHGISWHLVEEVCLPPSVCTSYSGGSFFHHSKFDNWQTVTVVLPPDTWSQQTKFQWVQPEWSDTDVWAVSRVYVGHACPSLCNGHGKCHLGNCRCESGYSGESCTPDTPLDHSVQADFGHRYDPRQDFDITGGALVRTSEGCGIILSGESLFFDKAGVRELVTKDVDTTLADFVQFWIQIGGKSGECSGADRRSESVLVSYSLDGGVSWTMLAELDHRDHQSPTFVHLELPTEAKTAHTRFQWWQPDHLGPGADQWAIDEVLIGQYRRLTHLEENFDEFLDPVDSGLWRVITEGATGKYCGRVQRSLVLSNQVNDKQVISQDLSLRPGDVLQFEINVDCGKLFRWESPVFLQYSHDQGRSWALVTEPCYLEQDCEGRLTEGSVYYTGTHGQWGLEVIPISPKIASHPTMFRWWQPGGVDHSFSLDNVYIGPPCPHHCYRRGVCSQGECQCFDTQPDGVEVAGPHCEPTGETPPGMLDRFDNQNMPLMHFWDVLGNANIGKGCGVVDVDNALYFSGDGTRQARTVELNTTEKSILQVSVKIGDKHFSMACRPADSREEGVVLDFSTDNGVTWNLMNFVEPVFDEAGETVTLFLELPPEAKTDRTRFRFWQPLGIGGMRRAEWAIDSVLVGVNDTSRSGFEDKFPGLAPDPHHWFLADAASPRQTCGAQDSVLEFSHKHDYQAAETWDYHVTPSTFLQFDLALNCGSLTSDLYEVILEYSTDHGRSWLPVIAECTPPHFECAGYHLSSTYPSAYFGNWSRVTVALPEGAVSPKTRFRWLRSGEEEPSPIWAIDNVYLGSDCPWLCSGHGVCQEGTCICDPGFGGDFCVAQVPLPMSLRDTFNSDTPNPSVWGDVLGGSNSLHCGPVVTDTAMVFDKPGRRMAMTHDIDSSMVTHIEFHFRYGCGDGQDKPWPRQHSVLLQYSTTGGILWKLVREIHFANTSEVRYYSIPLPGGAKHNATRFRFWQPSSAESDGSSAWAVDNLHIGPTNTRPANVFDLFQADSPTSGAGSVGDPAYWTFINNADVDEFCLHTRQSDQQMPTVDDSSLVFRRHADGEISAITTALDLGPMSVIQFDINVGCGAAPTEKYPVRLEYSTDGGHSWQLVGPDCVRKAALANVYQTTSVASACFESALPSTVYYAGETDAWRRVIVPLDHIRMCGPVRFRWYQGKIPATDFGPEWALDNVYIGMACMNHCNGHGYCIGGMMCQCDVGYTGPTCVPETALTSYLKDGFDEPRPQPYGTSGLAVNFNQPSAKTGQHPDDRNWQRWASGYVGANNECEKVFTGSSFVQNRPGGRELTTVPLNMLKANTIQFHLRLGCSSVSQKASNVLVDRATARRKVDTPPVYLQYSTNGGIYWTTIQQFEFSPDHANQSRYIAVNVPPGARTNSSQIRWWQPSVGGTHPQDWAIDQIYIGGNVDGEALLQDDPNIPLNTTWLEQPGARLDTVCDSDELAWHFIDPAAERYASTADAKVGEGSVLQFDLAIGCDRAKIQDQPCFSVILQYSLDKGQSWHLLYPVCNPSQPDCGRYHDSSAFSSDVHVGWNTVTLTIPQRAWSSQTRFRLYQDSETTPDHTWAVKRLYIGWECPRSGCNGHGNCRDSHCVCADGWSGEDCSSPNVTLPDMLVEDFTSAADSDQWERVVGGHLVDPCRTVASGQAMQFDGPCSRLLESRTLDLTSTTLIQFYFLYGCHSHPRRRDEGVLVEFSVDGGITWNLLTEMHFALYRMSTFISLHIPDSAKSAGGTKLRWRQPQHDGSESADWLIDGLRVIGDPANPSSLAVDFTSGVDFTDLLTADWVDIGEYCGKEPVAVASTPSDERSTLISREVKVDEGHVLYFSINVGCGRAWNDDVEPVDVSFSTDHGMSWTFLSQPCPEQTGCTPFSTIAHRHHHGTHDNWRRIAVPLDGLPVSNITRFRWQQAPSGMPGEQHWAVADIYVGEACPDHCSGRGRCFNRVCLCDDGFSGTACETDVDGKTKDKAKDTFDKDDELSSDRWPWAQGGQIQWPECGALVSDQALVMNGPGAREVTSPVLDLRDARFVQYTAMMWTKAALSDVCNPPAADKAQSVFLQSSVDGGVTWQTLHTLAPSRYSSPQRDYIPLPPGARTDNSIIRWVQADPPSPSVLSPRVHWAIDDVFVGGQEINPADYTQNFEVNSPETLGDDPEAWEFSPYGVLGLQGNPCGLNGGENGDAVSGSAMVFEEDGDESSASIQSFTTNQMIVQAGYMLQFKLIIGCGQYQDICSAPSTPVKLEYRRDPATDQWLDVQASCLPGSQGKEGLCNPHKHHHPSHYRLSEVGAWTRFTIDLNEVTSSSTTQFRWIQDGSNGTVTWALDDIYIGEKCPEMCRGRGDCIRGICQCDHGYGGITCSPLSGRLPTRLFDSFEGGVFPSHWSYVRGGGLGFGCGALLPHAHGKTLYFNGCGSREAVTAEMDTSHAIKIIFVIQIGCHAQTHDCNIELSDGPSYRGVLLQYSTNKGADWFFIAQHDATDFLRPKKVAYDIPAAAKGLGTQFRWWQPTHGGHGFDQWAIDHVEIISGSRRYNRIRGWRRNRGGN